MSALESFDADLLDPGAAGQQARGRSASTPGTARRASLRLVPQTRSRMSTRLFLMALLLVTALGMGGLVVMNTSIQSQAAELDELQQQATNLSYQQDLLTSQVHTLRSTVTLQQRAHELGMRPNPHPAFITLPDGKIVGNPTRVTGTELPDQRATDWKTAQQAQEDARAKVATEAAQKRRDAAAREQQRKQQAEQARKDREAKAKQDQAKQDKAKQDAKTRQDAKTKQDKAKQPGGH